MDNVPVNTILPTQQEDAGDGSTTSGGPVEYTPGTNPFIVESLPKQENPAPEKMPESTVPRTEVIEEKLDTIRPFGTASTKSSSVVDKRKERERLHPTHSTSDPVTTVIADEEKDFIEEQEAAHEQSR